MEERSSALFIFALLFCALACASVAILVGRGDEEIPETPEPLRELQMPYDLQETHFLPATQDAGLAYQDQLTFFGESTTAHLRSRGVLSGGTETTQVLADASGTKRLSSRLPYESVIDPESGESVGLLDLLSQRRPSILVLSFGLNGILGYHADQSSFVKDYHTLLTALQNASPNTKILLQTIYPITKDSDRFNAPSEINRAIEALNQKLPEIAAAHNRVYCVDTASVLKDNDGSLDPAFDNGDGYHLTASAYREILHYLRTHALEDL